MKNIIHHKISMVFNEDSSWFNLAMETKRASFVEHGNCPHVKVSSESVATDSLDPLRSSSWKHRRLVSFWMVS